MPRLVIPGMVFDGCDLGCCDQTFDPIDLNVGLSVSFDLHQADEVRHAQHGMALEEPFRIDSIGRADDRARPAFKMLDHPWPNLFKVARQIDLRISL